MTVSEGLRHHRAGNLQRAVEIYRQTLATNPNDSNAWQLLGVAFLQSNNPQQAIECLTRSLALDGNQPHVLSNLGGVYVRVGKLEEAKCCYVRALELQPDFAELHNNLGHLLGLQNDHANARHCFEKALQLKATYPEAHNNLGQALRAQGENEAACQAFRRALELNPNYVSAHNNLASYYSQHGRFAEAEVHIQRALAIAPNNANALANFAYVAHQRGNVAQAVEYSRKALAVAPNHTYALMLLGCYLCDGGQPMEAASWLERLLQLKPDDPHVWNNLGMAFRSQGKPTEAIRAFRRALELAPDLHEAHTNALFCEHYVPGVTNESLVLSHRRWDEQHAGPLRQEWSDHPNDRNPTRRLRVGFVSGDFGRHPVGVLTFPCLRALDPEQVEITLYSNRSNHDELTQKFQALGRWREVWKLSDEELARQVRDDQIDILVDLAGHTRGHRLLTFARKPAPVQMTWLGYEGTTGLAAIDYLVADPYVWPEHEPDLIPETVLRLSGGYVSYEPPTSRLEVTPLPALSNEFVTFGSFSTPMKVNSDVIETWCEVLRDVPNSRFHWKYRGMTDPEMSRYYQSQFANHGVESNRILFEGWSPPNQALAAYQKVDLALDTFPFAGSATTLDSLWMGVPVVTLAGTTFAGRHGVSHLTRLGLEELIAPSRTGFVQKSVALAQDSGRLSEFRSQLRAKVEAEFSDGRRLANELAGVFREAWCRWCEA